VSEGYDGVEDLAGAIQDTGDEVYRLAQDREAPGLRPMSDAVSAFLDAMETHATSGDGIVGIRTGLPRLDALVRGLKPRQFIVIAGRPGHGKSACMVQIALHAATVEQKIVGMFSLEMGREEMMLRFVSVSGQIDNQRILTHGLTEMDYTKVAGALNTISAAPLYVDDSAVRTMFELRAKARHLQTTVGLDMVMLDYIQLVPGDKVYRDNRNLQLAEISRSLKLLAKDLAIPVVALSQLSRDLEKRKNKVPVLSDLRDTGALEQDADIVIFVYRESLYKQTEENRDVAMLKVAKVRNGPIGSVRLAWAGEQTRFYESEAL
ncbi:MAG: replicative DNA helicase, partial [bacterium]